MSTNLEQRLSSQIQRVVRDGSAVFEKQYVTTEWDDDPELIRQRARREVKLLTDLSSSGKFRNRLGVAQIASANPEQAQIATHEIPGVSLDEFVQQNQDATTQLMPWLLAGMWLQRFQTLPIESSGLIMASKRDPADVVEYCDLRIRMLADLGYSWPNPSTRSALLGRIEQLRDHCERSDSKKVWIHADYSPGNLMWDGHTLTPIDFAMARTGGPLNDATFLIHRIEMHRVYRPWLRLPVTSIRQAILRGLGAPDSEQTASYQLLMIKHQICRLVANVRLPVKSFKQSLHNRWIRTALRRRLSQAISQGQR